MTYHPRVSGLVLAAAVAAASACGGDEHDDGDLDAVYLDEASDEVLLTLIDAADRGQVTNDDERCAHLTAPADGAELPAATPPTFSWEPAELQLLHGRATGDFVWLRFECPGVSPPVDLLALESTEWQPDAARWERLAGATGPCAVVVTSAFVDRGIIQEGGPFRPVTNPAFSIAP
jgi:hypothetical protein